MRSSPRSLAQSGPPPAAAAIGRAPRSTCWPRSRRSRAGEGPAGHAARRDRGPAPRTPAQTRRWWPASRSGVAGRGRDRSSAPLALLASSELAEIAPGHAAVSAGGHRRECPGGRHRCSAGGRPGDRARRRRARRASSPAPSSPRLLTLGTRVARRDCARSGDLSPEPLLASGKSRPGRRCSAGSRVSAPSTLAAAGSLADHPRGPVGCCRIPPGSMSAPVEYARPGAPGPAHGCDAARSAGEGKGWPGRATNGAERSRRSPCPCRAPRYRVRTPSTAIEAVAC